MPFFIPVAPVKPLSSARSWTWALPDTRAAPRRPQCNCETVEKCIRDAFPLLTILIKKHKRRRQKTNDKLSLVPTHLHELQSAARRGHAGCVTSLEQYSIRWQAG